MKKIVKMVVFLLAGIFLVIPSIPTNAKMPPDVFQSNDTFIPIAPFWTNVNNITLVLSNSSGKANCSGIIDGASGTTSIKATFTLERKSGSSWLHEKHGLRVQLPKL